MRAAACSVAGSQTASPGLSGLIRLARKPARRRAPRAQGREHMPEEFIPHRLDTPHGPPGHAVDHGPAVPLGQPREHLGRILQVVAGGFVQIEPLLPIE